MNTFFQASLDKSLSACKEFHQHFIRPPGFRVLKVSFQPIQKERYRQNTLQSLTIRKRVIESLLQATLPQTHFDFIVFIWNDSSVLTSHGILENHLNALRIARIINKELTDEEKNRIRPTAIRLLDTMYNNLKTFFTDQDDFKIPWSNMNIDDIKRSLQSKVATTDHLNDTTFKLYLNFISALHSIARDVVWTPEIKPERRESVSCAYYFILILADNKRTLRTLHELTLTHISDLQEQNHVRNQRENVQNADRQIHIHNNINPPPVYVYINGQLHDLPENDYRLPWGSPENATPNPFQTLPYFLRGAHPTLYMFGTNYTKLGDTKGQILTNSLQKTLRRGLFGEQVHLIMTRESLKWILNTQNDTDLNIVPNANDIGPFLRSIQTTHLMRYNRILDWIFEDGRQPDNILRLWGAEPGLRCFFDTVLHGLDGPDFGRDHVQPGAPLPVIQVPANVQPQAQVEAPVVEAPPHIPQQNENNVAEALPAGLEAPLPVQPPPRHTPLQDRDMIAEAAYRRNIKNQLQEQQKTLQDQQPEIASFVSNNMRRDLFSVFDFLKRI